MQVHRLSHHLSLPQHLLLPWGLEPVWACPKVMTLPWPVRFMSTNQPNVVKTLCPSTVIRDYRLFQDNRNPWGPIHQLIAKKRSMYSTSAQVCNRALKMLPKILLTERFSKSLRRRASSHVRKSFPSTTIPLSTRIPHSSAIARAVKMLSPVSIRTWQNGICYLASQQQDSQKWIADLGSTVVTNVRIEKWHICISLDDQQTAQR